MRRNDVGAILLAVGMLPCVLGAAPAAPSFFEVEKTIQEIRQAWAKPGATAQPHAPGWNAFFDALQAELRTWTNAQNERDQLASLNRIYKMSVALEGINWEPAARVREGLRAWLRPRVKVAWAERRLIEAVEGLPETSDGAAKTNRERWIDYVNTDLGASLRNYDRAETVAQRQEALRRVHTALNALHTNVKASPWVPTVELRNALDDLFNLPNLDIAADTPTLAPFLAHDVAVTGPVTHKGYTSQVTAGQKTGFGLLPSRDGIAFYNSQLMTSVTPVWDFNNQMASDPQGKRATKLYHFDATTTDTSELTVTAVLGNQGLSLYQSYKHNTNALICSEKTEGHGLGRAVAALIGMNQAKINQKVYDGAIGRIREGVITDSIEVGGEKMAEEQAKVNQKIREYIPGNHTLTIRNLLIASLMLSSQPQEALIGGFLQWKGAEDQMGAYAPQPASFQTPDPGVSADLHLTSIMTSLARGYLQSPTARDVQNLMVVTHKIAPNTPPSKGIDVSQNVDYPTFLKAVETSRAAKDPKVIAVRVKRPGHSPEFAADANGYLVALVHDFVLEVPAPEQATRGGLFGAPAQVYRFSAPQAEFVISFKVSPQTQKEPVRLSGRIESFDPGPQAKVYAVNEDETKAEPLTVFTTTVALSAFRSKLQGQPIDIPLSNLKLQGFAIKAVSPLDPSGWIRAQLVRTSSSPEAGVR